MIYLIPVRIKIFFHLSVQKFKNALRKVHICSVLSLYLFRVLLTVGPGGNMPNFDTFTLQVFSNAATAAAEPGPAATGVAVVLLFEHTLELLTVI